MRNLDIFDDDYFDLVGASENTIVDSINYQKELREWKRSVKNSLIHDKKLNTMVKKYELTLDKMSEYDDDSKMYDILNKRTELMHDRIFDYLLKHKPESITKNDFCKFVNHYVFGEGLLINWHL